MANKIAIEVVYATVQQQIILTVQVPAGSTVEAVIGSSGILNRVSTLDLNKNSVGIYGRQVQLTDTVAAGDRVEIYRPLLADPREIRRQCAVRGKRQLEK